MMGKTESHCYAYNSIEHEIRERNQRLKIHVTNTEGIRKIIDEYGKVKNMKIRPTEIAFYENVAIVCYIEAYEAQIEINERKEIFQMERTGIQYRTTIF